MVDPSTPYRPTNHPGGSTACHANREEQIAAVGCFCRYQSFVFNALTSVFSPRLSRTIAEANCTVRPVSKDSPLQSRCARESTACKQTSVDEMYVVMDAYTVCAFNCRYICFSISHVGCINRVTHHACLLFCIVSGCVFALDMFRSLWRLHSDPRASLLCRILQILDQGMVPSLMSRLLSSLLPLACALFQVVPHPSCCLLNLMACRMPRARMLEGLLLGSLVSLFLSSFLLHVSLWKL